MRHQRHRQERWLHTRITPELEEALKREARKQRTPVSLLVRNVLEGALDLVEEIVEDGLQIARQSRRFVDHVGRAASGNAGVDDVYGWQELILNRDAECGRCQVALQAGRGAHRGLREGSGPPVFLCGGCIRRLRQPAAERQNA